MISPADFESLYALQDQALGLIREVETDFYLTGGTASSRGYLHHRFSEDLDLFVNDDARFSLWADRIGVRLAACKEWRTETSLREDRFVRFFLHRPEIALKIELVNDVPSRIGEVAQHPVLGRLDTAENILANKISALIDRDEPKDLADIWGFCTKLGLSIESAIEGAQGKAAGLFQPDVARRLLSAVTSDWELIRWIEIPSVEAYLREIHRLGERLLLSE